MAKERVQRQAAERRIAAERDSSVHKMQTFEGDLRAQIRALEVRGTPNQSAAGE